MDTKTNETTGGCPMGHEGRRGRSNREWWPNLLNLDVLHQNSSLSNPMGEALQPKFRRGVHENPKRPVADKDARPCALVSRIVGGADGAGAADHRHAV